MILRPFDLVISPAMVICESMFHLSFGDVRLAIDIVFWRNIVDNYYKHSDFEANYYSGSDNHSLNGVP